MEVNDGRVPLPQVKEASRSLDFLLGSAAKIKAQYVFPLLDVEAIPIRLASPKSRLALWPQDAFHRPSVSSNVFVPIAMFSPADVVP